MHDKIDMIAFNEDLKERAQEIADENENIDDCHDAVLECVDSHRSVTYYSEARSLILSLDRDDEYTAFDEVKQVEGFTDVDSLDEMFTKLAWGYVYNKMHKYVYEAFEAKETT